MKVIFDEDKFVKNPLLSVCIITYNQEKYVAEAIEAVLMQKAEFPFEIIIAEDFSSDNTRNIVRAYQRKYPHLIKLLLQEKNVGPAQNWMDLITHPKTKYIAYLEADDYWTDANKLQKQVDFLESNKDCYLVVGNTDILLEKNITKRNWRLNNKNRTEFDVRDYINKEFFHASSSCFRNKNIPFDGMQDILQGDIFLFLFLASPDCEKIKFMEDNFSVYRIHEGGVTNRAINNNLVKAINSLLKIYKSFDNYSEGKYTYYLDRRMRGLIFAEKMIHANLINKAFFCLSHPCQLAYAFVRRSIFLLYS